MYQKLVCTKLNQVPTMFATSSQNTTKIRLAARSMGRLWFLKGFSLEPLPNSGDTLTLSIVIGLAYLYNSEELDNHRHDLDWPQLHTTIMPRILHYPTYPTVHTPQNSSASNCKIYGKYLLKKYHIKRILRQNFPIESNLYSKHKTCRVPTSEAWLFQLSTWAEPWAGRGHFHSETTIHSVRLSNATGRLIHALGFARVKNLIFSACGLLSLNAWDESRKLLSTGMSVQRTRQTLKPTLLRITDERCMYPASFDPDYERLRAPGQLLTRYSEFDYVRMRDTI